MKLQMPMWGQLKISDLIENESLEIGDGYRAKNSEMASVGLPFARAGNINNGFDFEDADFLSEKSVAQVGDKISQPDDAVITTKGTFGRVAYVRPNTPRFVYSPQLCYWRVRNSSVIQPRFVYYWLQGPDFLSQAFQVKSSTDMADYTSLTDQRRMVITAPDVENQKKIAAILSAYDELIENNQRRIALLEKMAEEIYREWFVRMRFPGYEKVKKIKGVPSGWEVRPLSGFASEIKRGVKKRNLSDDEKYLGLEHIPRRSISIKEWATANTVDSDKLLFQERDILFGKIRPYLHKVVLAHFSGACSSDTIVLRPKENFYEGYLLFTVFSDTFIELATVASKGTKMPRADWGFLKKLELAVPDAKLLKMFQTKFEILFSQIVNLLRANEVLTASRDLLLPRLISGKLSVEQLNIRFPPGMEESAHVN
ncbi:MAG: restriction endonuclease subunit S [Nitrosomonas sp.]